MAQNSIIKLLQSKMGNPTKALFLFFIFLLLCIRNAKGEVIDLEAKDYNNFKSRNMLFLITICNTNDSKCKNVRNVFKDVADKIKKEHNYEFKFAILNEKNLPENLWNEYNYEGFPNIYYVNTAESVKELFIGLRDVTTLYKFIKYQIIFPEENLSEVNDEQELIKKVNNSKEKKALVILGDFKSYPHFSFNLIRKAARRSGFEQVIHIKSEEVNEKYEVTDFDLAIYDSTFKSNAKNSEDETQTEKYLMRIKINKYNKYDIEDLAQLIILIDANKDKTKLFSDFNDQTFEYAFTYGIPTVFYLYSDKQTHLNNELEDMLKTVAYNYQTEFIFTKGSINNKIFKNLKFVRDYKITKNDLPMILVFRKPMEYLNKLKYKNVRINNDDVDKYILKNTEIKKFVKEHLQSYLANNSQDQENLSFTPEIVETFLEKIKENKYSKTSYTSIKEQLELNGENFVSVIDDALEKENSIVVLMICPKLSKKYKRIRSRVERVFNKIYEPNDKKIIFDEFDPLENELSFINYDYYPSIVTIDKSDTPQKWKVKVYNGKLTTKGMTNFIKSSLSTSVLESQLDNESEVDQFENEYPLYALHKLRYDGKLLTEKIISPTINVGLKRRWFNLKKNHHVLKMGEIEHLEYPNFFEEDDISEDFELEDDVIESHLHKLPDQEKSDL